MYILGIDLGGTNVKAVVVNEKGTILGKASVPTEAGKGVDIILKNIVESATDAAEDAGLEIYEIDHAGLGIAGNTLGRKGPVILAPNLGMANFNPVPILETKLGMPLFIENDADCMALAVKKIGAGKDYDTFVLLTLGTGVGGAVFINGEVPKLDPCNTEFGHMPLVVGGRPCTCGMNGCVEQYCSATALVQSAIEHGLPESTKAEDIFALADMGDKTALEVLDEYVMYLSHAICGLVNIFRPHAVIIGGGLANAGEALFGRLNDRIKNMIYAHELIDAPKIIPSGLGSYAGAVGAAMLE